MAEAYAKSLTEENANIEVTSSGIEADKELNGKVDPVAVAHLQDDGIAEKLSATWQQTTQHLLDEADVVVFMSPSLLADAQALFKLDDSKLRVFNVPDKDGVYEQVKKAVESVLEEFA